MSKVVVLMSTYNGAKYLRVQLESLLSQVGLSPTIIIRDDGSTDDTIEILESFSKSNSNIKYYQGINVGPCHSFFKLVQEVEKYDFDYYMFADQDDFWYETKVTDAIENLSLVSTELYCSSFDISNEDLKTINTVIHKEKYDAGNLHVEGTFPGCTMAFNKRMYQHLLASLDSPDVWKTSIHDAWLVRVALLKGQLKTGTVPQMSYRQHSSNAIGTSVTLMAKMKKVFNNVKKSYFRWSFIDEVLIFKSVYHNDIEASNINSVIEDCLLVDGDFKSRVNVAFKSTLYRRGILKNTIFKIMVIFNLYRRHSVNDAKN